jgi:hypothetical protein
MISFKNISHVDYTYGSFGTDWGITSSSWFGRHDEVESFTISIVTKTGDSFPICAFRGEGSKTTGWSGVLLGGDDIFDFSGTQEDESRKFAEYIAKLLDVTIGEPIDSPKDTVKCPKCGRPLPPYKKTCLYCGKTINRL